MAEHTEMLVSMGFDATQAAGALQLTEGMPPEQRFDAAMNLLSVAGSATSTSIGSFVWIVFVLVWVSSGALFGAMVRSMSSFSSAPEAPCSTWATWARSFTRRRTARGALPGMYGVCEPAWKEKYGVS